MFLGAIIVFICCGLEGLAEFRGGLFESKLRTDGAKIESILSDRVLATAGEARGAKSDADTAITNAGIAKEKADAANMLAQGAIDKIGPLGDRVGAANTRLGALTKNETALSAKLTTEERNLLAQISSAQATARGLTSAHSEGVRFIGVRS
jgi:hypothetical protein